MGGVNPIVGCLKEFWWFKRAFIMVATPLLLTIMLPYYEEMGLTKPVSRFTHLKNLPPNQLVVPNVLKQAVKWNETLQTG